MTSVCAHLMQRDRVVDRGGTGILYVHAILLFSYFPIRVKPPPPKLQQNYFNFSGTNLFVSFQIPSNTSKQSSS